MFIITDKVKTSRGGGKSGVMKDEELKLEEIVVYYERPSCIYIKVVVSPRGAGRIRSGVPYHPQGHLH